MGQFWEESAHEFGPLVSEVSDDLVKDLVLRGEVVVERGGGHACLSCNVGDGDLIGWLDCQQIDGGGEDFVAPRRTIRRAR